MVPKTALAFLKIFALTTVLAVSAAQAETVIPSKVAYHKFAAETGCAGRAIGYFVIASKGQWRHSR